MLLDQLAMTPSDIHRRTGWELKPEGACRDDVCVPMPDLVTRPDGTVDVRAFASQMKMPLAGDDKHGVWALGERAGGRVLATAKVPAIVLDDFDGRPFDLASVRGRKVLLVAWASW